MDTSDWTVEQHIEWIRGYAKDSKMLAEQVQSWHVDVVGTYVGMTEVVPWPEVEPTRRLRRTQTSESNRPDGTRLVIWNGLAYLIRDVKKED